MGRRQAQVWKKQQEMTNLDTAFQDKAVLQEKLRIKIALQIMRKAHVTGSAADKTRVKLQKLVGGDLEAFEKNENLVEKGIGGKYEEFPEFKMRSFDELMQNAKASYSIKKDKIKLENEVKRKSQLKEVCPELIAELKKEQREEIKAKRKQRKEKKKKEAESHKLPKPVGLLAALAQRKMSHLGEMSQSLEGSTTEYEASFYSDSLSKHKSMVNKGDEESRNPEEEKDWRKFIMQQPQTMLFHRPAPLHIPRRGSHENNDYTIIQDDDEANDNEPAMESQPFVARMVGDGPPNGFMRRSRETFIIPNTGSPTGILRPHSANNATITRASISSMNSQGEEARHEFRGSMDSQQGPNKRPSTAQSYHREISAVRGSVLRRSLDGSVIARSVSWEHGAQNHENDGSHKAQEPDAYIAPRTPSVIMRAATLDEDETLIRAIKKKEEQIHTKEEKLMKRIADKDNLQMTKMQNLLKQQRQRAWLTIFQLETRLGYLKEILINYRVDRQWARTNSKLKKAVRVIQKWWRITYVILRLNRNAKSKGILRRFFVYHLFRLKFRRKNRACDLIAMFLRESGVISESMTKIYAFRQDVMKIQRYVRSWFDVQQYRVRLLWMAGERLAKETAKQERIAKLKNEKSSMKALATLSGFAEHVDDINTVRKKISKVLEHQDEARKNREDLHFEILRVESKLDPEIRAASMAALQSQAAAAAAASAALNKTLHRTASTSNSNTNRPSYAPSPLNGGSITSFGGGGGGSTLDLSRKFSNSHNPAGGGFAAVSGLRSHNSSMMNFNNSSRMNMSSMNLRGTPGTASRRNARFGDIGANPVYLGISERCAADSSMQAWYRRIRTTPNGLKLFETLRNILSHQRKRHLMRLTAQQTRRKICPVEVTELQDFLKDPRDFSKSHAISQTIGGIDQTQAIAIDHKSNPFLLMTHGGLEQVEVVVKTNRNLRF